MKMERIDGESEEQSIGERSYLAEALSTMIDVSAIFMPAQRDAPRRRGTVPGAPGTVPLPLGASLCAGIKIAETSIIILNASAR